jgi:hypothetical protein
LRSIFVVPPIATLSSNTSAGRRSADARGRRRGGPANSSVFHPERRISVAARISQRISSGLPSAPVSRSTDMNAIANRAFGVPVVPFCI